MSMSKADLTRKFSSSAKIRYISNYKLKSLDVETDSEGENEVRFFQEEDVYTTSFPVIIKSNGEMLELTNLYFNAYLRENEDIRGDNLKSIAIDLLDYYRFIESNELDVLYFPEKVYRRVTYQYQKYLRRQVEEQKLSVNTAKQRIARVVNFYEECLVKGFINESLINQPYVLLFKKIFIQDQLGFNVEKIIKSSDLSIHAGKSIKMPDNIYDGGALRPLIIAEQEVLSEFLSKYGSIQLQLICYIAFHTGARLQSICTITVRHIKGLILQKNQNNCVLKVGYGTGIDTKKGQQYGLEFPRWLVEILIKYINSVTWKERAKLSFYGVNEQNYLFLTKNGSPFYTSRRELFDIKEKMMAIDKKTNIKTYTGGAVRKQFDELIELIQKSYQDFEKVRFHDLRATFGMNLLNRLQTKGLNNQQCLDYIKKRMGHKRVETTMMYLDYKGILMDKINTQDIFEADLLSYVGEL